jgi:hypothetical protein
VEPSEVEAAIAAYDGVAQCVVVAQDERDGPVLRAFVVPARPGLDLRELRERLRAALPDYAVPADVVALPALPLTANGKVDRAALPRPAARPPVSLDGLGTATERLVASVWRSVLGTPSVGPADNFFDIGGHSLAIVAVQARLGERLGRTVPIADLFHHPNVRALASYLDNGAAGPGLDRAARRVAARRDRERHSRRGRAETGGTGEPSR